MRRAFLSLAFLLLAAPAFATDYYFATGEGAGSCLLADPCSTVAHANAITYSPGDNLYFNRGDTFSDTTLAIGQSGTSGNPITITAYGTGANPIFGSALLATAISIEQDFHSYIGIDAVGTSGGAGENTVDIAFTNDVDNLILQDCNFSQGLAGTLGAVVVVDDNTGTPENAFTNATITDCTFTDGNNGSFILRAFTNVTMTNVTFQQTQSLSASNDVFAISAGAGGSNGLTVNNATVSRAGAPSEGDFGLDITSGTGIVFNTLTVTDSGNNAIHVADPSSVGTAVIFNDTNVSNSDNGWMLIRDTPTMTCNRCNFHDQSDGGAGTEAIQIGGSSWPSSAAVPVFNASVFQVESAKTTSAVFEMWGGVGLTLNNSTVIMRNSADNNRAIWQRNSPTGTLTIKNSILDVDGAPILESDGAGTTWTLDKNLYECDNATCADDNGTTYTEAQLVSSLDTSGSTTGDPLFVNETDTSNLYLMLNLGSPGIGLGDAANLYATPATDVHGRRFNGTSPNAGAASQAIQLKVEEDSLDRKVTMSCECGLGGFSGARLLLDCDCERTIQ